MRSLNVAFVLESAATSVIVEIYIYLQLIFVHYAHYRLYYIYSLRSITSQICLCYNPASNPTPVALYTVSRHFFCVIEFIYFINYKNHYINTVRRRTISTD